MIALPILHLVIIKQEIFCADHLDLLHQCLNQRSWDLNASTETTLAQRVYMEYILNLKILCFEIGIIVTGPM